MAKDDSLVHWIMENRFSEKLIVEILGKVDEKSEKGRERFLLRENKTQKIEILVTD